MSEDSAIKSKAIELIMKNPELSKLVQEAWNAPIGSTRRTKAKSVLSLFGRIQSRTSSTPIPAGAKPSKTDILSLIPNYTPTLHYAKPAPKRKVAQDGQGGPGPMMPQTAPLYVSQVMPWLSSGRQDGQGGSATGSLPWVLGGIGKGLSNAWDWTKNAVPAAGTALAKGASAAGTLALGGIQGLVGVEQAGMKQFYTGQPTSWGETTGGQMAMKTLSPTNPILQEYYKTTGTGPNSPVAPTQGPAQQSMTPTGTSTSQDALGIFQKLNPDVAPIQPVNSGDQSSGLSDSSYSGSSSSGESIQYPEDQMSDLSTPTVGSQWDLNAIPGLNIYDPANQGLSQTQYQMKVLNTISGMEDAEWQKLFPGVQKPLGATATQHTQSLINLKKKEMGLDQMLTGYNKMALENPKFKTDARDYIVAQDEFLKDIDGLLDDANTKMAGMPMDAPVFNQMMTNYKSYLTTMKGKTVSRYASYLNNAIEQRNTQMTQMKSDIDLKTQELNTAVAQGQEDWTSLVSMIGENYQKPALYAQNESENLKNQLELLKTQEEILKYSTGSSGTTLKDDDWKIVNQLQKTVDTGAGWNPGFDDITSLIKQYAPNNPKAVYYLMQATMSSSLQAPYDANKPVDKLALAERYANSISKRTTDLKSAATELEKANPADPRIGDINQEISFLETMKTPLTQGVKSVFGETLSSNWDAIASALKKVISSKSTFSDQDKQKFIDTAKKNGITDTKLLTYAWEALKRNAEAVRTTPSSQMTADWLGSMIGNSFMYSY